jgi:hypothetical protein
VYNLQCNQFIVVRFNPRYEEQWRISELAWNIKSIPPINNFTIWPLAQSTNEGGCTFVFEEVAHLRAPR